MGSSLHTAYIIALIMTCSFSLRIPSVFSRMSSTDVSIWRSFTLYCTRICFVVLVNICVVAKSLSHDMKCDHDETKQKNIYRHKCLVLYLFKTFSSLSSGITLGFRLANLKLLVHLFNLSLSLNHLRYFVLFRTLTQAGNSGAVGKIKCKSVVSVNSFVNPWLVQQWKADSYTSSQIEVYVPAIANKQTNNPLLFFFGVDKHLTCNIAALKSVVRLFSVVRKCTCLLLEPHPSVMS